jgi:hypothetical protein
MNILDELRTRLDRFFKDNSSKIVAIGNGKLREITVDKDGYIHTTGKTCMIFTCDGKILGEIFEMFSAKYIASYCISDHDVFVLLDEEYNKLHEYHNHPQP